MWAVAGTIGVLAYPLVVYLGLRRFEPRSVGGVLLAVVLLGVALRWLGSERRLRDVAVVPLATAALLAGSALLGDSRFMLWVPVVANAVLLGLFAGSLRTERPMVERFARVVQPSLSPAEVRYCWTVTVVWCAFFVLNGGVAAALAIAAPLSWWALYTGVLSYLAVGLLFTVEYLVRKWRFRRYGRAWHDRLLALVFPPTSEP